MENGATFTLEFIESLFMGTLVIDHEFHVTGWNAQMEKISGLRKSAVLNKNFWEIGFEGKEPNPIRNQTPFSMYLTMASRRILFNFNLLRDSSGESYGWIGTTANTSADDWMQNLSDGIVTLGIDLTLTAWNQAAERILGKSIIEKNKQSVEELPIIGDEEFREKCRIALNLKKSFSYSPADRFSYQAWIHPYREGLAVYLTPDEAADRSMADQPGAEPGQDEDLAFVLNSMGGAVITTDDKGLITRINPAAEGLTGWTNEEARMRPLMEVFKIKEVKTGKPIPDPVEQMFKTGLPASIGTASLTTQSGKELLVADSVSPIKKRSSEIIGAVVVFREVDTEHPDFRRMEEMEERFRIAFKTSPDAMAITRLSDGHYIEVNDGYMSVTGYTAEELLGHTAMEINLWRNPADRQRLVENLQKYGYIDSMEAQFIMKDGSVRTGIISARIIMLQGEAHLLSITKDLTQKIELQKELEETDQLIKYILKHDPNAIAVFDRNMNYLMTSDRYLLDYRLDQKDITGKNHYEVFPEVKEEWKAVHRRCLAGFVEKNDLEYFIRRDGTNDFVKWEVRPWFKSGGEVGGMILYSEVITRWVEAEQRVIARNEFIETILSHLPMGVIVTRINSDEVDYINPACFDIFDIPKDAEITTDLLLDSVIQDPEFRKRAKQMVDESKRKRQFERLNRDHTRIVTRRNNTRIISLFNIPLFEQDLLITVFQDITKARQAEEDRDRLFNFSIDMLFIAGFDGFFKQINPSWEKTLGWEAGELLNKPWMDMVYVQDQPASRMANEKLLAGEHMTLFENRFLCKNGDYKWLSWNALPLLEQDLIFGVVRDISKTKAIEEELMQRNSELNNFVYKVSHDLRAPLSSIRGLINLIKIDEPLLSKNEYIALIEQRIMKLDGFIRDILSHSKNLNTEIDITEVDFQRVVDDCFSELAYMQNSSRINKRIRIRGGHFYNDQVRIYEIFRNLISNSIKYINPFIENNKISIDVKISSSHAVITIEDNGIGIPEDHLARIFHMFFKGSEKSDSSGIGLYIVDQAVRKLKGTIVVESKSNEGSLFIIDLPNLKR